VEPSWSAICDGRSGIDQITKFDATGFETRIAGEVKDFFASDFLPRKTARRITPFIAYAVAASRMALEDSGLCVKKHNADGFGVAVGCAVGGLDILETSHKVFLNAGPAKVSPFFIPLMLTNMAPGMVAIELGLKGPNLALSTSCAAGTHAVGRAFRMVQHRESAAMIAGGVEAIITPMCIAGFNAMKALSTRNEEPKKASRPFDEDRDGFVLGEGAGFVVLESLEGALKRNARIYAEVIGFAMNSDAWHMTAPPPDGKGAATCMRKALEDAGVSPGQIDYINAHGTSTPLNDICETRAMKTVFGDAIYRVPVSATKSMTGHLLGGAGGIETVFTCLSIRDNLLPPTINLEHPDTGCDLDFVPHTSRSHPVTLAMTNSFGFGGINGSLILSRFEEVSGATGSVRFAH
jgi:3-oxoacyl-[acyl-carrier-protein] synthase II